MHLTTLKQRILDYIHYLSIYDYIAYGWLLALLICFLLLAIVLANKKPKLATFFIFSVFVLMFIGPLGLKYGLDKIIRNALVVDQNSTQLPFSKNLVVVGKIENRGKVDFQKCRVFVKVLKEDKNKYKQILDLLKPIRKKTLTLDSNISKGKTLAYRVVLDHFDYHKSYIVTQDVECY